MNTLFLELLQVAIGTRQILNHTPIEEEWDTLFEIAKKHAMAGICFAGLQRLATANAMPPDHSDSTPETQRIYQTIGMSKDLYLKWMGISVKIQKTYDRHEFYIMKLAEFYEKENIGMMLLKGYGLSRCYTNPRLRTPGDIDVFLFDLNGDDHPALPAWRRGDEAITRRLKVEVRNDSEHHTKFKLDEISVENHYDFINTRIRRSSKQLEQEFKELANDHTNFIEIDGQHVYLPSDALNALFLLRHTAGHFASEGVTLKNVLDWGFFIRSAHHLDWQWLWQKAHKYNMHRFLACLNAICIENLGFDADKFVQERYDSDLKKRVLAEILSGQDIVTDATVWKRTVRWWHHRWKHRICYSDSMVSSFIYSIRANVGGTSVESSENTKTP